MDYALQVHQAKYVFPIPDGLKELSSDIIREVLRHQPSHINGFIADYLETMLIVRDRARDSGVVICEALQEACFFDELFKTKNITRDQAEFFATLIQAAWRGYVVRRKLSLWLKKKKKFEEEKERKRSLKIEELLAGLGITYDEAKRAAGVIEVAYKESKDRGDAWMVEDVPLGQRIREADRVQGRFDRWEKEDFGDFFEIDEFGGIKYVWPRVGQLRKVLREEIPKDVPIIEFFAMRDLEGQEQYSYLIQTQPDTEFRGVPIGFLVPMPRSSVMECSQAEFVNPVNNQKMGDYTYIFRDDVDRNELKKFEELLRMQTQASETREVMGETEYDPSWVLPRVLVRIKKESLLPTDDEVNFVNLTETIVCAQDKYTFRAETLEHTLKIIKHIIKNKCQTIEEGLTEASNMMPYKIQETGRIFPVEAFSTPSYIQKIEITPESDTAEDESMDLMRYSYIFLPPGHALRKSLPKGESCFSISIIRFQGFHSDYKGSSQLENKVFIMGPKITTPDGKPFTYESLFWDDFGIQAWYQLLHDIEQELEEEEKEEEVFEEPKIEDIEKEVEAEKLRESEMGESVEDLTEITDADKGYDIISAPPSEVAIEPETDEKPGEIKVEEKAQEVQGEEKPEVKTEPEKEPKKEPEEETKPAEVEPKTEET